MKNIVIRNENALYYECGYSCDNAIFIQIGEEKKFVTDGRYEIEAKASVKDAEVIIARDIYAKSAKILNKKRVKKCAYDPMEWDCYSLERLNPDRKILWIEKPQWSHKKRIIKSENEIELLRKASHLGAETFDILAKRFFKEGVGLDEFRLTFMAEEELRERGYRSLSFEPIVAIGPNSAKPHALPTERVLKKGDLLLMDAGLKYQRYCSDRTRTAFVKEDFFFDYKQKFKSKKMQKVYDTVLKAHDKAISKAKSGMRAKKIDSIARDIIEKAGFGKYFVHSTGHGVGLDIHEMPYISQKSETRVEDSMVFTIEPGIYIPGEFGVRIEDTVVMVNGRAEIL